MNNPVAPRLLIRALFVTSLALLLPTACVWAQDEPEQARQEQAIQEQSTAEQADGQELSAVEVVDQVGPAVVTVINQQTVADGVIGDSQPVPVGAGTGFIIDTDGHIVTNWHVVTGGTSFLVILSDGTDIEAELIGEDPRNDLAVVKIDSEAVPETVPFGDSSQLQQGQTVLAIGSPLGKFGNTVTRGIISGLGRDQLSSEGLCQNYSDLIQHDAAINPGNSGGPLFNLQGEVIGVNTLGIPSVNGGVPIQGLFFAVPSNTVVQVVQEIIEDGSISAPYLGISFEPLNPQIAAINELPVDFGLFVRSVEQGTPADEAGLTANDIIVAVDGNRIDAQQTFSSLLMEYEPGDTAELTVMRDGQETPISITFGEVPQELFEQSCTLEARP